MNFGIMAEAPNGRENDYSDVTFTLLVSELIGLTQKGIQAVMLFTPIQHDLESYNRREL